MSEILLFPNRQTSAALDRITAAVPEYDFGPALVRQVAEEFSQQETYSLEAYILLLFQWYLNHIPRTVLEAKQVELLRSAVDLQLKRQRAKDSFERVAV